MIEADCYRRVIDQAVGWKPTLRRWKSIHHWKPALQSFQVMFGEDRVPLGAL